MSASPHHPPGRRAIALLAGLAAFFSLTKPSPAASPPALPPHAPPAAAQPKPAIEVLRETVWLQDLPEMITVPVAATPGATVTKRLDEATVDDVIFAVGLLNRQARSIFRVADDLQRLHDRAREAGAVGVDNAAAAAIKTARGQK